MVTLYRKIVILVLNCSVIWVLSDVKILILRIVYILPDVDVVCLCLWIEFVL